MSKTVSPRDELTKEIRLLLGDQMVDVELDPDHYNLAISISLEKLRQRSDGSLQEEEVFITIQPGVQEYTLPANVQEVRRLWRRGVGTQTSGGIDFNPADAVYANQFLVHPNRTGGLTTWDLYSSFLETTERVFASQYAYVWYNSTKTLRIIRKPLAEEDVAVSVWTVKSEENMLVDVYMRPWVRQYALAHCKGMLGQARNKYTSGLSGPTGNVTYNGDQLLQESAAEIERLDEELKNAVTGNHGYTFIIG